MEGREREERGRNGRREGETEGDPSTLSPPVLEWPSSPAECCWLSAPSNLQPNRHTHTHTLSHTLMHSHTCTATCQIHDVIKSHDWSCDNLCSPPTHIILCICEYVEYHSIVHSHLYPKLLHKQSHDRSCDTAAHRYTCRGGPHWRGQRVQ